jgi:predicted PP-loop superfamily ATPase
VVERPKRQRTAAYGSSVTQTRTIKVKGKRMNDNKKSHIWKDGKWVEVDKACVAEHQHNGKPEDCDRCNAMLHFDLTRLSNSKLRA